MRDEESCAYLSSNKCDLSIRIVSVSDDVMLRAAMDFSGLKAGTSGAQSNRVAASAVSVSALRRRNYLRSHQTSRMRRLE